MRARTSVPPISLAAESAVPCSPHRNALLSQLCLPSDDVRVSFYPPGAGLAEQPRQGLSFSWGAYGTAQGILTHKTALLTAQHNRQTQTAGVHTQ